MLKERVKTLKSEIEKAKEQDDKILNFMLLIILKNSRPKFCVRSLTR